MKKLYLLLAFICLAYMHGFGQVIFSESFEDEESFYQNWWRYDADGDYWSWQTLDPMPNVAPDGDYTAASWSINPSEGTAKNPNNWLISQPISLGDSSVLSFWVASSMYYPGDHFAVYICTNGDFDYNNPSASFEDLVPETVATGDFMHITVGIPSEYANEVVRIAFRHFNSNSDELYYLMIDDVTITAVQPVGPSASEQYVTACEMYVVASSTTMLQEDFEGALPSDWTIVDADGDGDNWAVMAGGYAHTGLGYIASASWDGTTYPQNWLITPAISVPDAGVTTLSWWAGAQDPSYYAEHYEVLISTASNAVGDFNSEALYSETLSSSAWAQHSFSLIDYVGQTVYIAFVHKNCSGEYRLNIDDIEVTDAKTICASELPYTWNGVIFNEAGTDTAILQTINGCDSVVTMTLTVNPIYSETDSRTICASELPYIWNGVTFTEAGTQTVTLPTVNNCDSVVTMTLTTFPTYEVTDAKTICPSELPYTWNGVTFTAAGTQTATLPTINGCDSVVTMTLTVNPIYSETDSRAICASELPYTWNGVTFTEAGTQTATLPTVNGCDSVVTMTLTVNPIYSETDSRTICASELPYTWNGVTFTEAGTQTATLSTVNGCDSVVTMTLTVNQPTMGIDEQEACDSFAWIDGTVYTESTNTPTFTLTNAAGCDSVVTLHLTIHESVTIDAYLTIHDSDLPYTYGDTTFEPGTVQSGDYTFYFTTVDGCDSIIVLHLTVLTGINDHAMVASMNVYPNPTTDMVNVQLTFNNESLNDGEIQLYDVYGKWLRTIKVTGKVTEIDMSSYSAGVYFVKAVDGQRLIGIRKLVKQ